MPLKVPLYSELPVRAGAPKGSAWGVFDIDGRADVSGTLNFITKDAVLAASQEIKTGESVVLNLPLHLPYNACSGRSPLRHNNIANAYGMCCCDDELVLNTQSSSQWDGLLHYANQAMRKYYNNVDYAAAAEERTDLTLGIQAMSDRGGIVGRGVLLDFVRYAGAKGIEYDPLTNYSISLSQIKDMLIEERITLRQGDILLIRSGVSKWIHASTSNSRGPFETSNHIGVDPTTELLEWIWNNNLAAVGGDAIAFEAIPGSDGSFMRLHESCLPGWGMPIGELLDLEALGLLAEKNKRWTFFLTICPLNVLGGAATIANSIAVY